MSSLGRSTWGFLAVAAALVLAAGVWVVLSVASGRSPTHGDAARRAPSDATTAPALIGRRPVDADEGTEQQLSRASAGAVKETAETPEAPADGPVPLRIRLVGEGPPPSEVALYVEDDDLWVHFRDGEREARLPTAETYFITARIDDWNSDQSWLVRAPTEGPITLEIRQPVQPTIRAVEEQSGAPVPNAYVRALGSDDTYEYRAAPDDRSGSGPLVRGDEQGRIRLPRTAVSGAWWVGAPMHGWTMVSIPAATEETRVPLRPGGRIVAEVEDWADLVEPGVVATRPDPDEASSAPWGARQPTGESLASLGMEPRDPPGTFALDGLPPGTWKIVVGRKGKVFLAEVWVEVPIEVRAGSSSEVRFAVGAPRLAARYDVDLEISIPTSWGQEEVSVELRGASGKNADTSRTATLPHERPLGPWRTRVLDLRRGPYQVIVRSPSLTWSQFVKVGPDVQVLRIEVPPPVELGVRVTDETGRSLPEAVVRIDYASWERPSETDPDDRIGRWQSVGTELALDRDSGWYRGRVAPGPIVAGAPGFLTNWEPFEPGPSSLEVAMRLRRVAAIEVRILRGGHVAPDARGEVTCWLPGEDEVGEPPGWAELSEGSARCEDLDPGVYVVRWDRPGGARVERTAVARAGVTPSPRSWQSAATERS